jgi:hypothetical protein
VPPLRFATLRPDQAGRETFILIAMWHAGHTKKPRPSFRKIGA